MKSEKELEKKLKLFKNTFEKKIARNENIIKKAKQDERERLWNKIKDRKILCNYDECEICSFLRELFKEYGVE